MLQNTISTDNDNLPYDQTLPLKIFSELEGIVYLYDKRWMWRISGNLIMRIDCKYLSIGFMGRFLEFPNLIS